MIGSLVSLPRVRFSLGLFVRCGITVVAGLGLFASAHAESDEIWNCGVLPGIAGPRMVGDLIGPAAALKLAKIDAVETLRILRCDPNYPCKTVLILPVDQRVELSWQSSHLLAVKTDTRVVRGNLAFLISMPLAGAERRHVVSVVSDRDVNRTGKRLIFDRGQCERATASIAPN